MNLRRWPLLLLILAFVCGCRQQPRRIAPPPPPSAAVERDIVYGVAGGQQLLLDVYRCPSPGLHPAVLLIHGGGWYSGDKAESTALGQRLTALGFTCFALNYRLTPAFRHPAQVQDCARAARWVRAHAAGYAVDPARLGAWGDSAGAHLALMLGVIQPDGFPDKTDPNRRLSARVQCVVDFYGPAEFRSPARWPLVALRAAHSFFGGWPDGRSKLAADASPAAHVTAAASPTLLVHGERDILVPLQQSELMKAALDKAGVENRFITVPGAGHNLQGASAETINETNAIAAQWLKNHLGK